MARKVSSPTKARNSKQTPQSVSSSDHLTPDGKRRGRKQKLQPDDVQPTELFPIDAVFADNEIPEPESADLEKALPAKARRGRKPKASSAPETAEADVSATGMTSSDNPNTTVVAEIDLTPEATPVKARRKRKIDSQPSLQEAAVQVDQDNGAFETDVSLVGETAAEAPAAIPSAAKWDAATDAISFDWPAIEQVAATEGPNRAMAKLLLAARNEGANSRWPF